VEQRIHHSGQRGAEGETVACGRCGTGASGPIPPVTWTCSVENGTRIHFCDACARDNIRAIEGRIDSSWW
jgi:hypothetical protein